MKKIIFILIVFIFSCEFKDLNNLENETNNNINEPTLPTIPEDPQAPAFNEVIPEELSPLIYNYHEVINELSSKVISFIKVDNYYYFISNLKTYQIYYFTFDLFKYDIISRETTLVSSFNVHKSGPDYIKLHYVLGNLYIIAIDRVLKLNADNTTTLMFQASHSIIGTSVFNNKLILDYRNITAEGERFYISSFDSSFNEEILSYIPGDMRIHTLSNSLVFNNKFIFICYNNGQRYCASDGTTSGTNILYNSTPPWALKSSLVEHNDKIYWIQDLGTYTTEDYKLLCNDGTTSEIVNTDNIQIYYTFGFVNNKLVAKTKESKLLLSSNNEYLVHELDSSKEYYLGKYYFLNNYALYIAGIKNTNNYEIWYTDGTYESTYLLKTLEGTDEYGLNFYRDDPKVINNKLFFFFRDKNYGFEPWISDGTSDGTFMLKDINPSGSSKSYKKIIIHNNRALFIANNLEFGKEIWYTDFNSNETNILIDLLEGSLSSEPELYFINEDILFASYTNNSGKVKLINLKLDF